MHTYMHESSAHHSDRQKVSLILVCVILLQINEYKSSTLFAHSTKSLRKAVLCTLHVQTVGDLQLKIAKFSCAVASTRDPTAEHDFSTGLVNASIT